MFSSSFSFSETELGVPPHHIPLQYSALSAEYTSLPWVGHWRWVSQKEAPNILGDHGGGCPKQRRQGIPESLNVCVETLPSWPLLQTHPPQGARVLSQWKGGSSQDRLGQIVVTTSMGWDLKPQQCLSVPHDMPTRSQKGSKHCRQ